LDGDIINIPDYNFTLTFKTTGSWNTYEVDVSRDIQDERYKVINDTDLLVIFNSHNLGIGKLECEWRLNIPNDLMPDNQMNLVVVDTQEIELWCGDSDPASAEISMELITPYISNSAIIAEAIDRHNADINAHENITDVIYETMNTLYDNIIELTEQEINNTIII
jgi:hypothetical protein